MIFRGRRRSRKGRGAQLARGLRLVIGPLLLAGCESLIGADFSRSLGAPDASEAVDAGTDATAPTETGTPDAPDAPDAPVASVVVEVVTGSGFSCARFSNGRVKCWGYNLHGQLGLGDRDHRGDEPGEMGATLPALDLGPGRAAVALAAGDSHTCARFDDGAVKCWGRNQNGALGIGDVNNRGQLPGEMGSALPTVDLGPGQTASIIAAGADHTCAILGDARVKCWGDNATGALGLGDTNARGDTREEMGAALAAVDLGPGRTASSIAAGEGHTCAILDDKSVKCWGANDRGQLGLGDTSNRGDAPGEMGSALPTVALGAGRTALEIAAAGKRTCARLDDGRIKCWGSSQYGALGLGDTSDRGSSAGQMGDALPAVDLGVGQLASELAAGSRTTCARLQQGRVKCWGDGGRLGLGDAQRRGDTPEGLGDALPFLDLGPGRSVIAIAVSATHSCVLLDDENIKCWGFNSYGGLGLGDRADRGDDLGEMGSALPAVQLE